MKVSRLTLALFALAACSPERTTAPELASSPDASLSRNSRDDNGRDNNGRHDDDDEPGYGVVFTLSNQTGSNDVLAYRRNRNGSLTPAGAYASGGVGTSAGLGSQNAVVFSRDGDLLFAVNAGSNSVSAFRVNDDHLQLVSTAPSGGVHPISLTAANGLLYVLNDGGDGNIAGLRYTPHGNLISIPNSSRPLSGAGTAPAQIEFTPSARQLVVTEKGTNRIGTYNVLPSGRTDAGVFIPSSGATPFGFAFRGNTLIVSEAFGGAPGASAASSYRLGWGSPTLISGTVPTTQTAACWFVVTDNGRFAYTTNTGSGTVTGYAVDRDGVLTRLEADGVSAALGASGPADAALSRNSRFLYTRNGDGSISAVRVRRDGSLSVLGGGISGLPTGAVGLAAR